MQFVFASEAQAESEAWSQTAPGNGPFFGANQCDPAGPTSIHAVFIISGPHSHVLNLAAIRGLSVADC